MSGPAAANPVAVEITRGPLVESRHRAAAVIVDATGSVQAHWGDHEAPVYPRSAIKMLQALPLVETGAADAVGLGEAELALACGSHGGEPRHVDTVTAWLDRIGLGVEALECGPHAPSYAPSADELMRAGMAPGPQHNNCSGKHAGFLTVARHLGVHTKGYVEPTHPVQQRVLGVLEQMTGRDLDPAARGVDGCSVPTWAIPLGNLAFAMARFAAPDDLPPARAEACRRLYTAMTREPFMVAGSGRYCTRMMAALKGRAAIKTGAEGVFCAALPAWGLGIALKCDDGAGRASQMVMTALLGMVGVLDDTAEGIDDLLKPQVVNRAGRVVGEIRPTATFRPAGT